MFECGWCGNKQDRDLNVAINIKQQGLKELEGVGTILAVKCTPKSKSVQAGDLAKGVSSRLPESAEAHTRTPLGI